MDLLIGVWLKVYTLISDFIQTPITNSSLLSLFSFSLSFTLYFSVSLCHEIILMKGEK